MSDRIVGFIVTLAKDIHEDDSKHIADVLRLLKGVARVSPKVANVEFHMAYQRARREISEALWKVLEDTP